MRTPCDEEARRFRYRTQGKPILLWLVDGVALRHHRAIGLSAAGVRRHSTRPHAVASLLTRGGGHIKLISWYARERGSCDHGGTACRRSIDCPSAMAKCRRRHYRV